ncbi:MAG: efflux RND transporter periplasmic adaptor subunit [Rudaea sp.]
MMLRPGRSVAWRRMMLLAALALLSACGHAPPPPRQPSSPPLAALTVQAEQVQREQVWDGVVEAVDETTIAAQTNARVLELPYDVGDRVAKGDVLVRFSDVEQQSGRRGAQGAVAAAAADYRDAEANWKRSDAIFARGLIARAQLDSAVARRDAARATLASAEAALRSAGQQADYTVLRAPFDGVITRRYAQVGEAVQSGPPAPQQLIALASLKNLRITVQVPQSAVAAIRQFNTAQVLLDDGRRVAAAKLTIFPYADPATHTFNLRMGLSGDDSGLYPGMTVKVAFVDGMAKRFLLPLSALVQRGEMVGVYVLAADAVILRQVRTGYRHGEKAEVLAGLEDGEQVATDPAAAARWLVEHQRGAQP